MAITEKFQYYLNDERWAITASVVIADEEKFSFASKNDKLDAAASVTGDLLDSSGNKTGSYAAYCEKVKASEYNPMSLPQGAVVTKKNTCYYLNGKATYDDDEDVVVNGHYAYTEIESVVSGNLRFVIERNYTDIDRDAYYVIRAVNDIGEEGPPSDISNLVTRKPDEYVDIKISVGDTEAEEHVEKYRVYRSATGTDGSGFLFVGDAMLSDAVDNVVTFRDDKSDSDLGEVMPNFGSVPKNLDGIVGMSGGFIAAYKGKDIYFSEPYKPYSFPYEYHQSVPFDIVGAATRSNYLYVMTKGALYAFVGDHPETITPLSMRFDVPCISKNSIAHVQGDIIYAGTTGLVIIGNGGARIFSDGLYTVEQYKGLGFENCEKAGEYDGKYFAVLQNKVMLFDFADGELKHTTLDKSACTLGEYSWNDGSWLNYHDTYRQTNTPYGETFITQNFDASPVEGTWKSKEFVFERPVAFTCARVRSESGSAAVGIRLYAEGDLVFSGAALHNKAFRLPVLRRECKWSVEVSSTADIDSVELAESMAEL